MKMDVETQTTEPNEDIETTLRKQIADLKCELEKANRQIEALQNQLLKDFKRMIPPSVFTQDFQTGMHLWRFLDT